MIVDRTDHFADGGIYDGDNHSQLNGLKLLIVGTIA